MLPPGHIAGGYITTSLILAALHPAVSANQYQTLLWLGTFFAFAPDLDMFFVFWKSHTWTPSEESPNHRGYYTHRPFIWLVTAALVAVVTQGTFMHLVALVLWTGSWTHFILDSFQSPGIMWLWPFSDTFYTLRTTYHSWNPEPTGFWKYWLLFVRWYMTEFALSFWLEVAIIVAALIVLVR